MCWLLLVHCLIPPPPKAEDGVESMRGEQFFAVARKIERMDGERSTPRYAMFLRRRY